MRSELPPIIAGFDLYHWHSFMPALLPALDVFPKRAKIVITLWGSDLYATAGVEVYQRQLRACELASIISVGTVEMRETFLAKFGPQWASKMRVISYGADHLDAVDCARASRNTFLEKLGIPVERLVVCVGNSAHPRNRQMSVLEILRGLDPAVLDRLAILVPMTYGQTEPYVSQIKQAANGFPCPVRVLDRFMERDEVGRLRCASDVFIHVPMSDQFSAAMCEALYAGSVLVTGAWLPFSRLRLAGVRYHELADLAGLQAVIPMIVGNIELEKSKAATAAPAIKDMMGWDSVGARWAGLYDSLLSGRGEEGR